MIWKRVHDTLNFFFNLFNPGQRVFSALLDQNPPEGQDSLNWQGPGAQSASMEGHDLTPSHGLPPLLMGALFPALGLQLFLQVRLKLLFAPSLGHSQPLLWDFHPSQYLVAILLPLLPRPPKKHTLLAMSGDTCLSQIGRRANYCHVEGGDQGCCSMSYDAQDSPHHKELSSPKCK